MSLTFSKLPIINQVINGIFKYEKCRVNVDIARNVTRMGQPDCRLFS
jgi:hypothetical protein